MAFHCSHCAVSYRMLDWHCSVFEFIFPHWFYVQDPAIVQVWAVFNPGIFLSVPQGSSGSRLRFPMQGRWNVFPLREKQRRQGVTKLYDESAGAANLSVEVHFFRRVSFMLWQFAKSELWVQLALCPIQLFFYNRPNKEEYMTTWDKNSFYKADCCVILRCLLLESYFRQIRMSCFTCYHKTWLEQTQKVI